MQFGKERVCYVFREIDPWRSLALFHRHGY
jgi:hypothetical protein